MSRDFPLGDLRLNLESPISGEKDAIAKQSSELEQRLKDLERQLVDQQSRAKEDLDDARSSAASREQEYAAQVSELARMMEG